MSKTHRVDLRPDGRSLYTAMIYRGEVIGRSGSPLPAAAKWILATGNGAARDIVEIWCKDPERGGEMRKVETGRIGRHAKLVRMRPMRSLNGSRGSDP